MRLSVRFTGRVQGVGFRATCKAIASNYIVSGWVRNEPDGTVAMEVQGPDHAVEEFLAHVQRTFERHLANTARHPMLEAPGERGFTIRY